MTMNENIESALIEWEKIYGPAWTHETVLKMVQYVFRNYGKMILHDESKSPTTQRDPSDISEEGSTQASHGVDIEEVIKYILATDVPIPIANMFEGGEGSSHISRKAYGSLLLNVLCTTLRGKFGNPSTAPAVAIAESEPDMKIVIKQVDATHKEAVLVIDDVCPHCHEDNLKMVPPDEPWHAEYLICPKCDSTYLPDVPYDIPELPVADAKKIEAIEQEWMNAPMGKYTLDQTPFVGDHHEAP